MQGKIYYRCVSGSWLIKLLRYFSGSCEVCGIFQPFKCVICCDFIPHAK